MIGSGTYSSSSRSLYITNTPSSTTPSNSYTNSSSSYVYAYRDINISSANDYEISFKWKAKGESGCWDAMYAALCPPSGTFPPSNITNSTNSLPSGYINVGDVTQSNNTTGAFLWTNNDIGWQTSTKTVTLSTTGTYRLVFYWKNDGNGGVDPPAAIDDISVTQAIPRHTLTVNASPAAGGTVSPTSGTYQEGSTVTLTATPASGYRFSSWTVSGTGSFLSSTTASTTIFTMGTANATVTANFTAIPTHTLTVNATAGGSVSTNGGTYYEGQTVNISATANPGYRFTGWTGATVANASSASTTFTMGTANATVTANFEAIPNHNLTVNADPAMGGTVSGSGTYYEGETTTLTATVNAGYRFIGWTVEGTGASVSHTYDLTTSFTMGTEDAIVTANYIPLYTLTVNMNIPDGGTISTTGGIYAEGETQGFNATVNTGYRFTGWTVEGTGASVSPDNELTTTFTMGTADATVTANFELIPTHTLTVIRDAEEGGTVNVADGIYPSGTYFEGETATLTVTSVHPAFTFTGWTVEGGATLSSPTATTTTFTMGEDNATVTAHFTAKPTHTLTVYSSLDAGGTVSAVSGYYPSGTYYEGETAALTATPNSGYFFTGWTFYGTGSALSSTIVTNPTFTMGTGDATVIANFSSVEVMTSLSTPSVSQTAKVTSALSRLCSPGTDSWIWPTCSARPPFVTRCQTVKPG